MTRVPSIFANPWALSLLLAMPLLTLAQLVAAWRSRRLLLRLGQPIALIGLLPPPMRFRWLVGLLFSFAMTALVVGAAGPHWGRDPEPQVVAGRDLVVLLDMSNSMRAKDAPPNRFERSVAGVRDLLAYVRARGGHRLGLVVFAADAQVVVPLTHDYNHFQSKLDALSLDNPPTGLRPRAQARSGTRLGAGLQAALAAQDPTFQNFQDVLLLSDGDDPLGNDDWQAGLRAIEGAGVPVYAVGVGDPSIGGEIRVAGREQKVSTRLNEYPLQEIARRTGGAYLPARVEAPPLADFFRQRIESKGAAPLQSDPPPLPKSRQAYFYFVALALFGLMAMWRVRRSDLAWLATRLRRLRPVPAPAPGTVRPPRRAVVAALTLLTLLAAAPADPEDWERRGNDAFAAGRFDEAARCYGKAEELSAEPGRIAYNAGVAHFNMGRYREAERFFRCALDGADAGRRSRALDNLGTCLLYASEGRDAARLAEAIHTFDQCVERGGSDEALLSDARHNLELAKQLWRRIKSDAPPPENDARAPDDAARPENQDQNDGSDQGKGEGGTNRTGGSQAVPHPGGTEGPMPVPSNANPAPGAGNVSPLTSEEQARPLPPYEARELLRQAAERIDRERRALRRGGAEDVRPYPDW